MVIFYTVDRTDHALSALSSIISIRKYAGIYNDAPIVISFVEHEQAEFIGLYESLGNVSITTSKRFKPKHGWSNKLIASHQIAKNTKGHCLSLDCDMMVVDEISRYLTRDVFNSRVAGKYSMPQELLKSFFRFFGLKFPEKEPYTMGCGIKGIFYPAIGVVYAPAAIMQTVFGNAIDYAKTILQKKMNNENKFVGQSSVCLAIHKNNIPVCPLPDEMSFHMGGKVPEPNLNINCKPAIMHCDINFDAIDHYKSKTMPKVKAQALRALGCITEAKKMAGM